MSMTDRSQEEKEDFLQTGQSGLTDDDPIGTPSNPENTNTVPPDVDPPSKNLA